MQMQVDCQGPIIQLRKEPFKDKVPCRHPKEEGMNEARCTGSID